MRPGGLRTWEGVVVIMVLTGMAFSTAQANPPFIAPSPAPSFPRVQVVLDSPLPLPREAQTRAPKVRLISPAPVPLEPMGNTFDMASMPALPLLSDNALGVHLPPATPLAPTDGTTMTPSSSVLLDRQITAQLPPDSTEYRIVEMPLNDFGIAMARRAGLNFIFNPAVRGTVSGTFANPDPIAMLHSAAEASGYKLVIKDGINAQFVKP